MSKIKTKVLNRRRQRRVLNRTSDLPVVSGRRLAKNGHGEGINGKTFRIRIRPDSGNSLDWQP